MSTKPAASAASPARAEEPASTAIDRVRSHLPAWADEAVGSFVGRSDVNLLLPAIPLNAEMGFGHKAKVSLIQIDTDPDHQEIYKVGKRGDSEVYALGKAALEKIANAAGIQFQTRRVDDRSNPDYCEFECMAGMKNESGQPVVQSRTKSFNMPDVAAESRAQRLKWAKNDADRQRIEGDVDREMHAFKKHLIARTETGAILRAIRGLLGIRSQWTRAELQKPFVLMRVDFQPDASDPETKRILLEQGANATRALFNRPSLPVEGRAEVVHEPDPPDDDDLDEMLGTQEPSKTSPATTTATIQQADLGLRSPSDDLWSQIQEAREILGMGQDEFQRVILSHGGDLQKTFAELNSRVDQRAAS